MKENEVHLAASIQHGILPRNLPQIEGYEIANLYIPAKDLGGDYYDFIPLSDDRYALVIADVSGKSFPASLLVNSLHASLRAHLEYDAPLTQIAKRINVFLSDTTPSGLFATCLLMVLTPTTGNLDIVNAGH